MGLPPVSCLRPLAVQTSSIFFLVLSQIVWQLAEPFFHPREMFQLNEQGTKQFGGFSINRSHLLIIHHYQDEYRSNITLKI